MFKYVVILLHEFNKKHSEVLSDDDIIRRNTLFQDIKN